MELIFNKHKHFNQAYSVTGKRVRRIALNAEEELFLEGNFFYRVKDRGLTERFYSEKQDEQLKDIFRDNTVPVFIETVEGVYAGIHVDKKNRKITVFSDKLKRQEVYYYTDADEVIVATSLSNLQPKAGAYSQNVSSVSCIYMLPRGR